jgi:hypothetical protein
MRELGPGCAKPVAWQLCHLRQAAALGKGGVSTLECCGACGACRVWAHLPKFGADSNLPPPPTPLSCASWLWQLPQGVPPW